jgi:hypothetical protein
MLDVPTSPPETAMSEREAHASLEARTGRKQQDERRMRFRRAIESYDEQRRLQAQLTEFPDLAGLPGMARRSRSAPVLH